ncbi:MAG: hypothetical protein WDN46_22985 [Methylocella sp.]
MIIWLLVIIAIGRLIEHPSWPAVLILAVCVICFTFAYVTDRVMDHDGEQS